MPALCSASRDGDKGMPCLDATLAVAAAVAMAVV